MKKVLLLLLQTPFASFSQSCDALFLGNSYASYNNLPAIVPSIADSVGDPLNDNWCSVKI